MAAHKTPVTLLATERQAQLAREGKISVPDDAHAAGRPSVTSEEIRGRLNAGRRDEFADAAAHNLIPEQRFPKAAAGLNPDDEFDGATMTLESSSIKPYDRNPRRSINPNYDEIKESIRVKGVLNQITVTRRPGTPNYMVYGGGNTRLAIVQELDQEQPGNPLYSHMKVVYRAWHGEADVIAAHLVENEARGDTTFWDKAGGLTALKKELEVEAGIPLSSNEVRIKVAALGWKVSRQTIQIYDFATEWLRDIGPWLTFNAAQVLKDRTSALSTVMTRLDLQRGQDAFSALLSEELTFQATRLKAAQDAQGFSFAHAEADAAHICTALEERVANAIGTSVPELRQMLAILATNAQASASHLRSEAAKGVVGARSQKPPAGTVPAMAATQVPLPAPVLSTVRPAASATTPSNRRLHAELRADLPSIESQGDLPPELTVDNATVPAAAAADPQQVAAQAARALLDALHHLASITYNTDLFVVAPGMPLGYLMDLPPSPLQPIPSSTLPAEQQIRLRHAGWQLLATLSSQLDHRCCNERCMPEDSRWLQAVHSNGVAEALKRCGITVLDGRIHLEAECLFYILTEPRLLSPTVFQVLGALAIRRETVPNLLPPQLEPVSAPARAA